ncbi:hypothetical protein [Nevskia ramosa]|uniref:hypothetical protein n=1 Tax=Nevskia ramosa TaxID=64002 RepID=UPI003D0A46AC
MAKVSIKGVLIGAIVTLLLDLVAGGALVPMLGGGPLLDLPQEEQAAALDAFSMSAPYLTGAMIIGLLTTVFGGYIAARVAKREPYLNSSLLGVVGVLIGLALGADLPVWYNATALLLTIPASLLGGHFARGKASNA